MVATKYVYGKLPAQDVERARTFYEEKLGLTPYGDRGGYLYYEVGGAHFLIYPSTGHASGTHDQLGFEVEDVRQTVEHLRERGVTFEEYQLPGAETENGILDRGFTKSAWFIDSEGNLISIAQFEQSPYRRS